MATACGGFYLLGTLRIVVVVVVVAEPSLLTLEGGQRKSAPRERNFGSARSRVQLGRLQAAEVVHSRQH